MQAMLFGVAGTAMSTLNASHAFYTPPPVYRITATSLHDAGLQHGRLARARIHGWFACTEMQDIFQYIASEDGATAFARMKSANADAFPDIASELAGIAEGAQVSHDHVYAATFINELESLMLNGGGSWPPHNASISISNATTSRNASVEIARRRPPVAGHCTDVYAVAEGGADHGFALGHNEDWPGPIWQYWYFASYTPARGHEAAFAPCAGMVYPGSIFGWAGSWNAHGVFLTQNSLFPTSTLLGGMSSAFMQRSALCGRSTAGAGLDAIINAMTRPVKGVPWSAGASINLVSLKERRMVNVEMHEGASSVHELQMKHAAANYSHMNMYKHLAGDRPGDAGDRNSTRHRQARLDALPAPRSAADVRALLSDTHDPALPIFRPMTLQTLVLDGKTGTLDGWCCGTPAGGTSPPAYSFRLIDFFGSR